MTNAELFAKEWKAAAEKYGIQIRSKDTYCRKLWKVCDFLLRVITFNQMRGFYTDFTTTTGLTIVFPAGFRPQTAAKKDIIVLRHEMKHVKQCLALGFGNATLGKIIMAILYFCIPFPIGLAWFRYKFEREAYRISWYAARELGFKPDLNYYIELLTGPKYVWAWPFKKQVTKWFKENCKPS